MANVNIKDFILDTTITAEEKKTTKKKANREVRYEIVLVSGCDFVIKKFTARTEKTLCVICSQEQFYIKDDSSGGSINELTKENLKTFLSGVRTDDFIPIIDSNGETPSWIDRIYNSDPFRSRFINAIQKRLENINENLFWLENYTSDYYIKYFDGRKKKMYACVAKITPNRKQFCKAIYGKEFDKDANMVETIDRCGNDIVTAFGMDGLRQFAARYYDSPVGSSLTSYAIRELLEVKSGIKFSDFADYVFNEGVRQGYADDIDGFVRSWADYLKSQKRVYGKIKNVYSKNLATDEMILAYEARKIKQIEENEKMANMAERLSDKEFESGDYMIVIPTCASDFVEEGRRMSNCIATYAESCADGKCDIFFIRKKDNPNYPIADLEIREGKIAQLRMRFNKLPDESLNAFANEFVRNCYPVEE